jgi:predicted transcriptional regulator
MSKWNIDLISQRSEDIDMARIAFTLRIDPEDRSALENLSKIEGRPINQLLNEAIKSYLSRKGRRERSLEANLAGLRAYRKRDPGFQRGIAAFVAAEASIEDPLEGEFIKGSIEPSGPSQRKIREVLGA